MAKIKVKTKSPSFNFGANKKARKPQGKRTWKGREYGS